MRKIIKAVEVNEITVGQLMKLNKDRYAFVEKNASKFIKDKIDLDITNTLILRWIKGRKWEGGLGNGKDVDRMFETIADRNNLDFSDVEKRFDKLTDSWEDIFKKNGLDE